MMCGGGAKQYVVVVVVVVKAYHVNGSSARRKLPDMESFIVLLHNRPLPVASFMDNELHCLQRTSFPPFAWCSTYTKQLLKFAIQVAIQSCMNRYHSRLSNWNRTKISGLLRLQPIWQFGQSLGAMGYHVLLILGHLSISSPFVFKCRIPS